MIEELATDRRLATVRRIAELRPIPDADRIEVAVVDGWHVVTKKGEHAVGDLCVYLEIDSWVPTAVAPFLTKPEHFPKVYQEVQGERLKTVRLRGQISQGLLLPVSPDLGPVAEGDDLTERMGILKWERPLAPQLQGVALGSFPSQIHKTDQERVQNSLRILAEPDTWEVTIKLDGSSMTCFIDGDDQFGVCSRNLRLKEIEGNAFWDVARAQNLEAACRSVVEIIGAPCALQGELMGPGIQGNKENLKAQAFYLFDIFNVHTGAYLLPGDRQAICDQLGIQHVPVLDSVPTPTVDEALALADGPSLNAKAREGVVFKSTTRPGVSFKAISNAWLLAGNE